MNKVMFILSRIMAGMGTFVVLTIMWSVALRVEETWPEEVAMILRNLLGIGVLAVIFGGFFLLGVVVLYAWKRISLSSYDFARKLISPNVGFAG